ncbi:hypothetical protein GNX71_18520 [Variovorax sp. RKNM96]|nr:hypothetical protein GNX71_18520 [Variovorax sp. RKNM96]
MQEADDLDSVVTACYMGDVSVASNFARIHAAELAMAASRGLITTLQFDGNYGRKWRPTYSGYLWVQSGKHQDV